MGRGRIYRIKWRSVSMVSTRKKNILALNHIFVLALRLCPIIRAVLPVDRLYMVFSVPVAADLG